MIDIKELRVGNYVAEILVDGIENMNTHSVNTDEDFPIIQITAKDIFRLSKKRKPKFPYIDIAAIPLTEEWLLNFGFEKRDIKHGDGSVSMGVYINNPIIIIIDEDFIVCRSRPDNKSKWNYINSVKYLHQLQNLFYCLSGKELELNK